MERDQVIAIAIMAPQLFLGALLLLWRRKKLSITNCGGPIWRGSGGDAAAMIFSAFSLIFLLPEFVFQFFTEEWAPTLSEFIGCLALAIFGCASMGRGYFSFSNGKAQGKFGCTGMICRGIANHLRATPPIFLVGMAWTQMLIFLHAKGLPISIEAQELLVSMGNLPALAAAIALLGAVVLAPIGEEILFRGAIYRYLKGTMGAPKAAVASSLLFAILHGNLCALLPLFVLSLLITLAYEHDGNILPCIVMHCLFNCNGAAMALCAS
ncbi:MAG: CPBP family intramembrane metalloprotease [Puniceicoccales bacterium]|jgi:membrane protease YdiL (CAAX protease family)|nr:CPBP family intramembrane metalloprotease [Puniceicoccales bacterium]